MRIVVFGPQNFHKEKFIEKKLEKITKKLTDVIVVTGTGPGVNLIAAEWGVKKFMISERIPLLINKHKDKAKEIRDKELFDEAKAAIIFWNGKCKETKEILEKAKQKKLILRLIQIKN